MKYLSKILIVLNASICVAADTKIDDEKMIQGIWEITSASKEIAMVHSRWFVIALFFVTGLVLAADTPQPSGNKVDIGTQAPKFIIQDAGGKKIDLKELTEKGPVLVRLTCGCSGCDKELAYFQAMHDAYKDAGLTSLAIFREPDDKVAAYVKEKKLNMLYAVDTKGDSWKVFETKTMPTNFLIEKGGKIVSIAAGCDPTGLLAKKLSEKVAKVIDTDVVDVQKKVAENSAVTSSRE